MKLYYYLKYEDEYIVLVGQQGVGRIGLIGASFSTETRAIEYVNSLNDEAYAQSEADKLTEQS